MLTKGEAYVDEGRKVNEWLTECEEKLRDAEKEPAQGLLLAKKFKVCGVWFNIS